MRVAGDDDAVVPAGTVEGDVLVPHVAQHEGGVPVERVAPAAGPVRHRPHDGPGRRRGDAGPDVGPVGVQLVGLRVDAAVERHRRRVEVTGQRRRQADGRVDLDRVGVPQPAAAEQPGATAVHAATGDRLAGVEVRRVVAAPAGIHQLSM